MEGSRAERVRSSCLLACALIGACALQGCSFLFVHGPPANHPQLDSFDCTTSNVVPVIDGAVAGFETVRTIVAVAADDSVYDNYPLSRGADIGIGVALTGLFVGSAIYGATKTGRCSDAKAALERRRAAARSAEPYVPAYRPAASAVCSYDAQCKGDRICEAGRCVSPPAQAAPPSLPAQPTQPTQPEAPAQSQPAQPTTQPQPPAQPAPQAAPVTPAAPPAATAPPAASR